MVSSLSCLCQTCLIGEDDPCPNADFTDGWRSIFLQQVQSNSKVKRSAGSKKSAPIVKPFTCNLIDLTFHGTCVAVAGASTNLDEFGEHTFVVTGPIDPNEAFVVLNFLRQVSMTMSQM